MILSRGAALRKLTGCLAQNLILGKSQSINKLVVRRGHGHGELRYRTYPRPEEIKTPLPLHITCGLIWWWVFWHLFTDYKELLGTDLPDPSKWTDEELGIPPEDAD